MISEEKKIINLQENDSKTKQIHKHTHMRTPATTRNDMFSVCILNHLAPRVCCYLNQNILGFLMCSREELKKKSVSCSFLLFILVHSRLNIYT